MKKLFKNLHASKDYHTSYSRALRYLFKFYSKMSPYIPVPLVISNRDILSIIIKEHSAAYRRSHSYKGMISHTRYMNRDWLQEKHTRGGNCYAVGPGCMYYLDAPKSYSVTPIFVMTVANKAYGWDEFYHLLYNDKEYIEVFINNDIRSINQTLWGYVRNLYIPLLQLEGIRFQFKSSDEIMELTTVSYEKPKFSSLKEMKEYNKNLAKECSLRAVLTN